MNKINDGGPAFPTSPHISQNHTTRETVVYQHLSDGISVRDYFAAKAMQGLRSDPNVSQPWGEFARDAYEMADAMLEARK
jgi:hypothetical protein